MTPELEAFLTTTHDLLANLERHYAMTGGAPLFADLISDLLERTHEILSKMYAVRPDVELAEALEIIAPHRAFAHDRAETMRRTIH